ncbi:MAG: nitrogenase-stabilizing/protective protein NifW [Candidatus Sedimenticola endophacoides]
MSDSEFDLDLEELSSAEDFLEYFDIEFSPAVVHVNRLHILQRFHDYLDGIENMPGTDEERFTLYAGLLKSAYSDFVNSDALTEKVFKVFRMNEPMSVEIPLMDITSQVVSGAPKV